MANANQPFSKDQGAPKTDPVAEAHAAELAAKKAEETKTEEIKDEPKQEVKVDKKTEAPVAVVQDTKVVDQSKVAATQEVKTVKEEPSVKDTPKTVSREPITPTIAKPVTVQKQTSTIQRPNGASAREASPVNTGNQAQQVVSNEFSSTINNERVKGTASSVALIMFLDNYVKVMAPRRITSTKEVIKCQEGLYDQLMTIITRAPAKEFNRLWNIAIMYVKEYKDAAFSPMYYSRGAKDWKRDPSQFLTLTSFLNLLQASAKDISSVNEIVSVNSVVGKGFSEDARARVINFYNK